MINNIHTSSRHLYSVANESSMPYVSPNDSIPMMGMVRCINQRFEVYNGGGWISIPSASATIAMNNISENAIQWAIEKMEEEKRIAVLAKENPTVADALGSVKKAQEQLDMIVALIK